MEYELAKEKEYLTQLRNSVFKILHLYEEENEVAYKHIHSTIIQLQGLEEIFTEIKGRPDFIGIFAALEYLYDEFLLQDFNEDSHQIIRGEVLKYTNVIDKIIQSCEG